MIRSLLLTMTLILMLAGSAMAAVPTNAQEFLTAVDNDVKNGILTSEEALMIKFNHVFDKDQVPAPYKVEAFAPLKCATPLIQEFDAIRSEMSREHVQKIDGFLAEDTSSRATYYSLGGHFHLIYTTSGSDGVPPLDVDPANGVPDFVEKIAEYFETTWDVEVDQHGFQAPPIGSGTYYISFADQQSYGYTSVVNYNQGSTRITMHPTYVGFAPNDDPEGDVWGAAKVTAAHEFKHATQFATSRWSEDGWNEVDATWAEDLVYDYVNDLYNYLPGDSPVRHPESPLDNGPTGTGSYEDCIWEIWMSETWGVEFIYDYWEHRRTHRTEEVMDSFETIMEDYGTTLDEGWGNFIAWNYGVNYRAIPGVGYEEADRYPYGNFTGYTTSYPYTTSNSVPHLAARTYRLLGLDDEMEGTLDIDFNGADSGGPLVVSLHIELTDGTGAIEVMTLDENNDGYFALETPLEDIAWAGCTVGNAAKSGNSVSFSMTLLKTEAVPEPGIELDTASVSVSLEEGQSTTEYVNLNNNGESGSVLNYGVQVWGNSPVDVVADKDISGSTLTADVMTYLPGTTFEVEVTVFNGSTDENWLTDVIMDFPLGVTVNSSTDMIGGSYGPLETDNATGDGATIVWHGDVGAQHYGRILDGESADATFSITVSESFSGDLVIPSIIEGDDAGSNPHTVNTNVVIAEANPEIVITHPNGGESFYVGDTETITWTTNGTAEYVDVAISIDGGNNWSSLAEDLANTGSLDAIVNVAGSIHALIRVSDTGSPSEDISDAEFNVIEPVSWLVVNPASGVLNQGQNIDLALDFDSTGQASEVHEAWVVVNDGEFSVQGIVPVTMEVTGDVSGAGTPEVFALNGNYPNPFNPMTQISFNLPAEARTSVQVLDIRGHVVRTLYVGNMTAGPQRMNWDGKNDDGHIVAAGMYLARLRTVGYEATVKMTLAK
ncbi:MAG: hypothetical protein GY780_14325 [bacterium]|nr:hypothetical protein [bacterium]